MILDYASGIHPNSGKNPIVDQDIISVPFWTEEFCQQLIAVADFYDNRFKSHEQKNIDSSNLSYDALYFSQINQFLFEDFTRHYKKDIIPIINKIWPFTRIAGWQSPFILKYSTTGKKSLAPHHDLSEVSMNIKLNVNYQGGELVFPRQGINNQNTPAGYMLLWPSTVTHYHQANRINDGVKYSVTGWTWPSGAQDWHGIKNA